MTHQTEASRRTHVENKYLERVFVWWFIIVELEKWNNFAEILGLC